VVLRYALLVCGLVTPFSFNTRFGFGFGRIMVFALVKRVTSSLLNCMADVSYSLGKRHWYLYEYEYVPV
jgi:hypothetical protein